MKTFFPVGLAGFCGVPERRMLSGYLGNSICGQDGPSLEEWQNGTDIQRSHGRRAWTGSSLWIDVCLVLERWVGTGQSCDPGTHLTTSFCSTLRIWTMGGDCLQELHGHTSFVYGLASIGGDGLVSCGEDRSVRVWKGWASRRRTAGHQFAYF
jgi:WD40 repeat protein